MFALIFARHRCSRALTVLVHLLDGLRRRRRLAAAVHVDRVHSELVLLAVLQIEDGVTGGAQLDCRVDPLPRSSAR